jgi:hypothetical protein
VVELSLDAEGDDVLSRWKHFKSHGRSPRYAAGSRSPELKWPAGRQLRSNGDSLSPSEGKCKPRRGAQTFRLSRQR